MVRQRTRSRRSRRRREYTTEYILIEDIQPYEFNPRDNERAIQSVANSLEEFGWMVPCIIDADNLLVAGHTRLEAAKLLGDEEVLCYRAEHLSEEQLKAFRIIDNKLSELADWNQTLLSQEMASLTGVFDFTEFGWGQEEIDCLGETVADDCLSGGAVDEVTRGDTTARTNNGAGPQTTRIVVGEFVFNISIEVWQNWSRQIKEHNDFQNQEIVDDIKRRLGITEYE